MKHWRKTWYSLVGPLMIWVAFIIAAPFLTAGAIISADILPPFGVVVIRTVSLFCVLVLAPLGALAEIAPPFVTREEVQWRNRNSDTLFEIDVAWEDVPFLPPILNRIRSTPTKHMRQERTEGAAIVEAKSTTY
ncbi:hypothetical protein SAMN02982989_0172 [Xaviernesmea oryzae]|uniref:Uncharacterized protein n=1 Tax=Xaviernesmea oryzae TaxID=464029 RepID=A0A1X7FQ75_9HYPH|nr:hypothetical protein [Xaviernesmea oryzae]SMF56502.1 hypothetical protein SAMN02982989_0172 [Xaviernesmea oryzae]